MSLFSKRKKLLAIGCSYTDNCWTKTHGFPVWPELLAKKLDWDYLNLGSAGKGNNYIFGKMCDTIIEDNYDLVVIMWSEFQRMDFEYLNKFNQIKWKHLHPHRNKTFGEGSEIFPIDNPWKRSLLQYNDIVASVLYNVRLFWTTQNILKDIPHLMIQGPKALCTPNFKDDPYPDDFWKSVDKAAISSLLKSPYIELINSEKFIGWPIYKQIGGMSIDSYFDDVDYDRKRYRIHPIIDTHPNTTGHEVISELIYDNYRSIYL